eukprot:1151629-Pelagomonas_calceolata.AAC.4
MEAKKAFQAKRLTASPVLYSRRGSLVELEFGTALDSTALQAIHSVHVHALACVALMRTSPVCKASGACVCQIDRLG